MTVSNTGYCIFIETLCEGTVPAVHDAEGKPWIFESRIEAEREIADNLIARLQEFIDGERDFDDAMSVEEHIAKVVLLSDGSVVTCAESHDVATEV